MNSRQGGPPVYEWRWADRGTDGELKNRARTAIDRTRPALNNQAINREEKMIDRSPTRRRVLMAAVLASLCAGPALSADSVDRDAAKREGKVVWYTSTPIEAA